VTPPPLRAFIRVSPSSLSAGSSAGRSIWARATDGQADRLEPPEVNTHLFRRRPAAPRSFRLRHNAFAGRAAASVASFELAGSCGRADQPRAEQPVESGVRIRRSARRRRSSRGREAGRPGGTTWPHACPRPAWKPPCLVPSQRVRHLASLGQFAGEQVGAGDHERGALAGKQGDGLVGRRAAPARPAR